MATTLTELVSGTDADQTPVKENATSAYQSRGLLPKRDYLRLYRVERFHGLSYKDNRKHGHKSLGYLVSNIASEIFVNYRSEKRSRQNIFNPERHAKRTHNESLYEKDAMESLADPAYLSHLHPDARRSPLLSPKFACLLQSPTL
jgi:hypothetical protein